MAAAQGKEILLIKGPDGRFAPVDDTEREKTSKIKTGEVVRCTVSRMRNVEFHKKAFSLFRFGFDNWEPVAVDWRGIEASKDFEEFRNNVTILAGFFETVINLRGDAVLRAKSLSFASMDQDTFERCYKAVRDVIFKMLNKQSERWTPEEFNRVLEQMEAFYQ